MRSFGVPVMVIDSARRDMAIRVAWLYHDRGLSQQEVANRLGLSRSTISRLLSEAERDGIVRVVITQPLPESARLAEALVERYGVSAAVVGHALDGESPMLAAAIAMARRLETIVAAGSLTIAAGWGRTIASCARETRPMQTTDVTLVDAFGHTTTDVTTAAVEVTSTLARKFDAKVLHVPSPGFASTAEVAASFLESAPVQWALKRAMNADVILVSVGVTGASSLLIAEDFMTSEAMDVVVAAGAVGEIFGRYFDPSGVSVEVPSLHPIALTLDELRAAPRVITVASGVEKAAALKAAIASGILNEIVVDETLAISLLG